MASLCLSIRPFSSSGWLYAKPPLFYSTRSRSSASSPPYSHQNPYKLGRNFEKGICRAEFSHDAPVATAIGACMLSSFILPVVKRRDDEEEDESSAIISTDTRFAAMGVISFIPYFNWLSWVFAWLDTGRRRYAVYSLVYLLPYLSSNLSISLEDSWLPVASIVLGIVHVQLEASIVNGDLQTLQLFSNPAKHFSPLDRKKKIQFHRHHGNSEEKDSRMNLPLEDQHKEQNSNSDNEEK